MDINFEDTANYGWDSSIFENHLFASGVAPDQTFIIYGSGSALFGSEDDNFLVSGLTALTHVSRSGMADPVTIEATILNTEIASSTVEPIVYCDQYNLVYSGGAATDGYMVFEVIEADKLLSLVTTLPASLNMGNASGIQAHLVASYNILDNVTGAYSMRLWANGELLASSNGASGGTPATAGGEFYIGYNGVNQAEQLVLDNVRVYKSNCSDLQAYNLYQSSSKYLPTKIPVFSGLAEITTTLAQDGQTLFWTDPNDTNLIYLYTYNSDDHQWYRLNYALKPGNPPGWVGSAVYGKGPEPSARIEQSTDVLMTQIFS